MKMSGRSLFYVASVILGMVLFTHYSSAGGGRGKPSEAIAMVKRTKALYVKHGFAKVVDFVNNGLRGTRDRDLYVFITHVDGWMAAHPFKALRGLNIKDIRDSNDVSYYRQQTNALKHPDKKGWARYTLANPVTQRLEKKKSYLEYLNKEYYLGVGVYERGDN